MFFYAESYKTKITQNVKFYEYNKALNTYAQIDNDENITEKMVI